MDCTVETKYCTDRFKILGFPTIYYVNEPERIEFSGIRTLERVEEFVLQYVGKPSFEILKPKDIKKTIQESDHALIFVYDGMELSLPFLQQITKSVKNKIPFYICPEKAGYEALGLSSTPTEATMVIYSDHGYRREKYTGTFVDSPTNKEFIKNWILKHKDPLVPKLDSHNQGIMTQSKYVLILLVDPESVPNKDAVNTMKKIAIDWKQEYPNAELAFTWLDAITYATYVNQVYGIKTTDLPIVIITKPKVTLFPKIARIVL